MNGRRPAVTISYAHGDSSYASRLGEALRGYGFDAWVAHEELRTGDDLSDRLSRRLSKTDWLVVLVSESTIKSRWIDFEVGAAVGAGNSLLLVYLSDDARSKFVLPRMWAETRHVNADGLGAIEAAGLVKDVLRSSDW